MSTNKYKSISYIDRIKNKKQYKVVPETSNIDVKLLTVEQTIKNGRVVNKSLYKSVDEKRFKGLRFADFSISNQKAICATLSPVTMSMGREAMEEHVMTQLDKISSTVEHSNNNI